MVAFAGGNNILKADKTSIDNIAGGTLYVAGDATDQLVLKGEWTKISDNTTAQGLSVDTYQFGSTSTQAIVQDGIDVRISDPQSTISIDDIGGDVAGLTLQGDLDDDWYNFSVATAGDLNGDGFDDVVVGVGRAYSGREGGEGGEFQFGGKAFVVFGDSNLGTSVSLGGLDGDNGFTLVGEAGALGSGVGSAGDIDGDGRADLIVGDPYAGERYGYGSGRGRHQLCGVWLRIVCQ